MRFGTKISLIMLALVVLTIHAHAEIYYRVNLSDPYNAMEKHITNFSTTTIDNDRRPAYLGGSITWHVTNISATKNDTVYANAWVENYALFIVISELRYNSLSAVNSNKSNISKDIKYRLESRSQDNIGVPIAVENVTINDAYFLMVPEFRCNWEQNGTIAENAKKEDFGSLNQRDIIMIIIGIVLGALSVGYGLYKSNKSQQRKEK